MNDKGTVLQGPLVRQQTVTVNRTFEPHPSRGNGLAQSPHTLTGPHLTQGKYRINRDPHLDMCMCTRTHTQAHTCAHMRSCVHACNKCAHLCTYVHTYSIHACMHAAHIHMHTDTNMHTRAHLNTSRREKKNKSLGTKRCETSARANFRGNSISDGRGMPSHLRQVWRQPPAPAVTHHKRAAWHTPPPWSFRRAGKAVFSEAWLCVD